MQAEMAVPPCVPCCIVPQTCSDKALWCLRNETGFVACMRYGYHTAGLLMPQPQNGSHCVVCVRWFDTASIKAAAEHSLGKHCRTLIPCPRTLVAALLAAQPVRPVLTGALVCVGTLAPGPAPTATTASHVNQAVEPSNMRAM